jgi:hypothetical protein
MPRETATRVVSSQTKYQSPRTHAASIFLIFNCQGEGDAGRNQFVTPFVTFSRRHVGPRSLKISASRRIQPLFRMRSAVKGMRRPRTKASGAQ